METFLAKIQNLGIVIKARINEINFLNKNNSPTFKRVAKTNLRIDRVEHLQQNFYLDGVPTGEDQIKSLQAVVAEQLDKPVELPVPQISGGGNIPALKNYDVENPKAQLLGKLLGEYQKNKELFLSFEYLTDIYESREKIEFTKEELVFLAASSLKHDFPCWYWSFYYRENNANVTPLFEEIFNTHDDIKIKSKSLEMLGKFKDTADSIFSLAGTSDNPFVIGKAIQVLFENKSTHLAAQIINSSLKKEIIPNLEFKKIERMQIKIDAEARIFLYEKIKKGWPREAVKCLEFLSLGASEEDLLLLEGLLTDNSRTGTVTTAVYRCISSIGSISKKELLDTGLGSKWEPLFLQAIKACGSVNNREMFPVLFKWYKDSSIVSDRYKDIGEYKFMDILEDAIIKIMDIDIYNSVVEEILKITKSDPDQYIWTWRHFSLLKGIKRPALIKAVKEEKRLAHFPEWRSVVDAVVLREISITKNKDGLLGLIETENYTMKMLALRELWTLIRPSEALEYSEIINELRKSLSERLELFVNSDCHQGIKKDAAKGLDYFFGENETFYRNYESNYKKDDDKYINECEKDFYLLRSDIGKFERIDEEYIKFIGKEIAIPQNKKYIIDQIGRPYSEIYQIIEADEISSDEIASQLLSVIEKEENIVIVISAIKTAYRKNIGDQSELRRKLLSIADEYENLLEKSIISGNSWDNDAYWKARNVMWSVVNGLTVMGKIEDMEIVERQINSDDMIVRRGYNRLAHFYDMTSFRKLHNFSETETDIELKSEATEALDDLDYGWSKKILGIEN